MSAVFQGVIEGARVETEQTQLLDSACRKNAWRLVTLLAVAYVINYLDRNSVAFAGLTMNSDLGLSATQYGMGAGLVFASYCTLEVPSNLLMHRVGARRWIARIMVTWGIAAAATTFVTGPIGFYVTRLLLGAAEAGFVPGVFLYLSIWFPAHYRTRMLALFLLGVPVSSLVGGPLSGLLLQMNGIWGLAGWKWMFLIEAAPAIVAGILAWFMLVDHPKDATWLTEPERDALLQALEAERLGLERPKHTFWKAILDRRVLVLTAIMFGFTLGSYGVSMWLPLIMKQHGLSNLAIGWIAVLPYGCATLGMLAWARHVDYGGDKVLNLTLGCLLSVVGLVLSVVFATLVPALIGLSVALVGVTSARTVFWTIPPSFLAGAGAAGGLAFINSVGTLGGFVGPVMMGWLKDATGSFTPGLLAMAAVLVVATGLAATMNWLLRPVSPAATHAPFRV